LFGKRTKGDAAPLEIGYRGKQVRQRSAEPIQFPHDKAIVGFDESEGLSQASTISAASSDPVLEQMTFIDAGGEKRITL
jgi:hypothetical protein